MVGHGRTGFVFRQPDALSTKGTYFDVNPALSRHISNSVFIMQYLDIILEVWGNWELFQDLLAVLRVIGDRHGGLSIANIAIRWVLDHSFVGAVLIGSLDLDPINIMI